MASSLALIVVPVYNTEKYILECLTSIYRQSYQNFICLIIDDGSTDCSQQVINEFLNNVKDSRFVLFSKLNGGVSTARNFALDKAQELHIKPDYLFFIDSDDYIHQDYLLKFISEMSINDCDYAVCGYTEVTVKGIKANIEGKTNKTPLNQNQLVEQYFSSGEFSKFDNYSSLALFNKAFKYDLVKDFRFNTSIIVGEDMLFFANCASKLQTGIILPDSLYYYRLRKSSAMHDQNKQVKVLKSSVQAFKEAIEINKEHDFVKAIIARFFIILYDGFKKLVSLRSQYSFSFYQELMELKNTYPDFVPVSHKKKISRLKKGYVLSVFYLKVRSLMHKNKSHKASSFDNIKNFFD